MKKLLLSSLIAITFSHSVAAADFTAQINSDKPNVVLVLAEDMNPRIGAYGDPVAYTPNIDALAKEAVLFTHAFTMAGVSSPSRAGLITGVPAQTIGLQHMRTMSYSQPYMGVPPSYIKAYPELLRRNGYFTYVDTKTDYQFTNGPYNPGPFSIWSAHGSGKNMSDLRVPAAWENYDLKGKPFFINLNPQITHESGMFTDKNVPAAFKQFPAQWRELKSAYTLYKVDPANIPIDPYWKDSPEVRQELALFYENINVMDQQVGNIIQRLKKDGLWDNTIFIFSADNGDGLPRHKREGYDSGTHVPLIIHVPDKYKPQGWHARGEKDGRLISFEDLAPTILGFTHTPVPFYMKGIDYSKDNARQREFIYSARGRMDDQYLTSYYVRSKDFQYVQNIDRTPNGAHIVFRDVLITMATLNQAHENGQLKPEQEAWFAPRTDEELYNLHKDPKELHNIATEPTYKNTIVLFREKLEEWRNQANDMNIVPEAQMVKDLLDEHGNPRVTHPPVVQLNAVTHKLYIANRTTDASIGYSFDGKNWELYTHAFSVPQEVKKIYVKAVRYGWKESEVSTFNISSE